MFGGSTIAFASKLAPTLDLCRTQILCPLKIKCGSELAREDGLSVNTNPSLQQVPVLQSRHCFLRLFTSRVSPVIPSLNVV